MYVYVQSPLSFVQFDKEYNDNDDNNSNNNNNKEKYYQLFNNNNNNIWRRICMYRSGIYFRI